MPCNLINDLSSIKQGFQRCFPFFALVAQWALSHLFCPLSLIKITFKIQKNMFKTCCRKISFENDPKWEKRPLCASSLAVVKAEKHENDFDIKVRHD